MRNLTYDDSLTQRHAMQIVFNACRGNTKRESRVLDGRTATFRSLANGFEHEIAVRDADGTVVLLALVDQFDR